MNKRLSIVLAALLLAALIPTATATGQCSPIRYRLYENSNYGGHASYGLCVSEPDLQQVIYGGLPWENFNNNVSSIKLYTGASAVTLYDGLNYTVPLKTFYASSTYVGNAYNDKAGSAYNGYTN